MRRVIPVALFLCVGGWWIHLTPLHSQEFAHQGRVLVSVPRNETEFKKIFDRNPTALELKGMSEFDSVWRDEAIRVSSFAHFEESLATGREFGVTIVVGHNEDGRFRFLDGSVTNLSELETSCARKGSPCVFLSCSSSEHLHSSPGVPRAITFEEAAFVSQRLRNAVGELQWKGIEVTNDRLQLILDHALGEGSYLAYTDRLINGAMVVVATAIVVHAVGATGNSKGQDCSGSKQSCLEANTRQICRLVPPHIPGVEYSNYDGQLLACILSLNEPQDLNKTAPPKQVEPAQKSKSLTGSMKRCDTCHRAYFPVSQ